MLVSLNQFFKVWQGLVFKDSFSFSTTDEDTTIQMRLLNIIIAVIISVSIIIIPKTSSGLSSTISIYSS